MITVEWANASETLLKWSFGHQWTRNDFMAACHQAKRMVESKPYEVNVVVDLSVSRLHPSRLIHLALAGMRMRSANIGQVVVISPSNLWMHLYQYLARVYKTDVLSVQFVPMHHDAMMILDMPFSEGGWADSYRKLPAYTGQSVAPFYSF